MNDLKTTNPNRNAKYDWNEISTHNTKESRWIVIDNSIYDVTRWAYKHPGGMAVLRHYSGQDATEAFRAFHKNFDLVGKYLKVFKIGELKLDSNETSTLTEEESDKRKMVIKNDFEDLRKTAESMNLFQASPTFFILHFAHIVLFEMMAYFFMTFFGSPNWITYFLSVLCYVIVQGQASWLQHDFGHLSVFKNTTVNHLFHYITMGAIKGASPNWWNHMHYQHHSKPNVIGKDPDVRIQPMFVVGTTMPVEYGRKKYGSWPYHLQHHYFHAIGPPLLFPVYFQLMTLRHAVIHRCYLDLASMSIFFIKLFYLYAPILGFGGALAYYFLIRFCESYWFTWVSQSNHIPMEIERDREEPWLALQIHATCDIEKSFFNDWFTGHLNFQIEHHLFPTMPRHNYYKIQPYVKQLCEKHNIPFCVKPLWVAFKDIIRSLKHSGELWHAAYHAYHLD